MPRIDLDERGTGLRLGEADGTRRRILIITPGAGTSGYYPAEVLERDGPKVITAGTQMFLDHPGRAEERDRPERSVRDLAAVLETDAFWDPQGSDGPGLYATARVIPTMAGIIDGLAEHIGVSIRGYGESDRDGTITALTAVESVDFVTRAGRGGKVLELLEAARFGEALTANELRDAVWDAVRDRYASDDVHVYVQDFSVEDGWVVFEQYTDGDETYHRAGLTVDQDTVTVEDDAVEVERQVTYVAASDVTEALREARTALAEARNVGAWFEAHIHRDFTVSADDAYANGRLTRDERIALSSAIGDALDAFRRSLETDAPHLYDRDPYADPEDLPTPARTEEATVPTIEELTSRVEALEAERDTAIQERDEARTELARRQDADRVREANDAIATAVAAVDIPDGLGEVAESIRERAARTVTVTRDDQGRIVTAALDEAARAAVEAEVTYLVGVRKPGITGLGESTPPAPKSEDELREANAERATKIFG